MEDQSRKISLPALLVGDGRSLVTLTGIVLIFAGAFAIFLSATGSFLPHDVAFLGMEPRELCAINECRIVHFMFHDRVSFGGVLIATGLLYLWIAASPLRNGEAWAWWTLLISGAAGFASFLSYLGFGYLDAWHGVATLFLLPCFLVGMWKTRQMLREDRSVRSLVAPGQYLPWLSAPGVGRLCLLAVGAGKIVGGLVIMIVGMTWVFVPQDIEFLGLDHEGLNEINPRLIPLIAHDRAGFGGALVSSGLLVLLIAWKALPSQHLSQALLLAGGTGFVCAIGVHYPIGYVDFSHLAPAWLGAIVFSVGLVLFRTPRAAKNETLSPLP